MNRWRAFCVLVAWLAASSAAYASVTANSNIAPQAPNNGKQTFIAGTDSAGTFKTVYTAGANGSQCYSISMSNDDTALTHVVTFTVVNGATTFQHVTIVSNLAPSSPAGQYTVQSILLPSVWFGLPTDGKGNNVLQLVSGDILKATFATGITTSDEIDLTAVCWDF